jgi:hypothetical protein
MVPASMKGLTDDDVEKRQSLLKKRAFSYFMPVFRGLSIPFCPL